MARNIANGDKSAPDRSNFFERIEKTVIGEDIALNAASVEVL